MIAIIRQIFLFNIRTTVANILLFKLNKFTREHSKLNFTTKKICFICKCIIIKPQDVEFQIGKIFQ